MRSKLLLLFALLVVLLTSIYSLLNSGYLIGGDVMFPIRPQNNLHKMYMWYAGSDSLHYLHGFWYLTYFFFEKIGIESLMSHRIFITFGNLLAFYFTYKIIYLSPIKLNYKKEMAILGGLLYVYNPIVFLVVPGYLPYFGIPICTYFFLKVVQKQHIFDMCVFSLLINYFFFIDFPQPKMLIMYFFLLLYFMAVFQISRKVLIKKVIPKAMTIFLSVNAFIFLPFFYSIFEGDFGKISGNISNHKGLADMGSASLNYISRFFNTSSYMGYDNIGKYLSSPYFSVVMVVFFLLILFFVISNKKRDNLKYFRLSLLFYLIVLFIAKGPNPPLGSFYQYVVTLSPIFSIFRTTANTVLVAVIPFIFLLIISLDSYLKTNKKLFLTIIVLILVCLVQIHSGSRFQNRYGIPHGKGITIPWEYFDSLNFLDKLNTSERILVLPFPDGYVSKTWGYFGPDIISWMSKENVISRSSLYGISTKNGLNIDNIGRQSVSELAQKVPYIVFQKDSIDSDKYTEYLTGELVYTNKLIDIYHNNKYLPTIYSPDGGYITYKKNNPTHYRVTQSVSSDISNTVILQENYNKDWRLCYTKNRLLFLKTKKCTESITKGVNNAWSINEEAVCSDYPHACYLENGKKVISYTIEFWPQKILYLGLFISLLSCLTIIISSIKTRNVNK